MNGLFLLRLNHWHYNPILMRTFPKYNKNETALEAIAFSLAFIHHFKNWHPKGWFPPTFFI